MQLPDEAGPPSPADPRPFGRLGGIGGGCNLGIPPKSSEHITMPEPRLSNALSPGDSGECKGGVTGVEGVEEGVEILLGLAGEDSSWRLGKVKTVDDAPLPC